MYGLEYSNKCWDIVYGNRFHDTNDAAVKYGQHSRSSTDWAWCYTRGQCWSSTALGGDTSDHAVPNPGACDSLRVAYLDRRYSSGLAASCSPVP